MLGHQLPRHSKPTIAALGQQQYFSYWYFNGGPMMDQLWRVAFNCNYYTAFLETETAITQQV